MPRRRLKGLRRLSSSIYAWCCFYCSCDVSFVNTVVVAVVIAVVDLFGGYFDAHVVSFVGNDYYLY